MKDIYEIELGQDIFDAIVEDKCKFIVVLADKVHQAYKAGNIITICCNDKKVVASITKLLYFQSVKELVDMIGKESVGFLKRFTTDKIEDELVKVFTPAHIEKYGLIAVGFEKKEN